MPAADKGVLVEREAELEALEQGLASARSGKGVVVSIRAAAGAGKTRLVMAAAEMARAAGMRALGASGRALESDLPFAVAIQLFEQHRPPAGAEVSTVIFDLFAAARDLCGPDEEPGGQPLAVLVDDLQWVDRPSLQFLAYLAARISDLPIALVVSAREGEPATDEAALNELRDLTGHVVVQPRKLSVDGVAAVVRSAYPDAGPEFWGACAEVTDGSPFLLAELLEELPRVGLHPDAATPELLGDLSPEPVVNEVRSRLAALPAATRNVARAVAVLGNDAPLHLAAAVAELDVPATSRAADALAQVHLFRPGSPLSFAHPLIGGAVRGLMLTFERGSLHQRAATALRDAGALPQEVGAHLLASPLGGDADAVEWLRTAAGEAIAAGAAGTAVPLLERALDEAPNAQVRTVVLTELREARRRTDPPNSASGMQGEPTDGQVTAFLAAATFAPERFESARKYGEAMFTSLTAAPTPRQRIALAHLAIHSGLRGNDRLRVRDLFKRAWGDGALLAAEPEDGSVSSMLGAALLFVDEAEQCLETYAAAQSTASSGSTPRPSVAARYGQIWALYHQGRVTDALSEARAAIDGCPGGSYRPIDSIYGALAACQLQLGKLERAEVALAMLADPGAVEAIDLPVLFEVRAQLRLAQMRPAEALGDALEAGRRSRSAVGAAHPGILAWRTTAAFAHLALDQAASAHRLAQEELELARAPNLIRGKIRALRVLGLADKSPRGLGMLEEAVRLGEVYPTRLEYMHALVDLGAALRRANQRSAARAPLRRALELGGRYGASALAERAQQELVATGARSRRTILTGVEALTPSERRVADLAGDGRTTRQIASALFVTPKTVEFHLRHVYRKLDIPSSRAELIKALRPEPGAGAGAVLK